MLQCYRRAGINICVRIVGCMSFHDIEGPREPINRFGGPGRPSPVSDVGARVDSWIDIREKASAPRVPVFDVSSKEEREYRNYSEEAFPDPAMFMRIKGQAAEQHNSSHPILEYRNGSWGSLDSRAQTVPDASSVKPSKPIQDYSLHKYYDINDEVYKNGATNISGKFGDESFEAERIGEAEEALGEDNEFCEEEMETKSANLLQTLREAIAKGEGSKTSAQEQELFSEEIFKKKPVEETYSSMESPWDIRVRERGLPIHRTERAWTHNPISDSNDRLAESKRGDNCESGDIKATSPFSVYPSSVSTILRNTADSEAQSGALRTSRGDTEMRQEQLIEEEIRKREREEFQIQNFSGSELDFVNSSRPTEHISGEKDKKGDPLALPPFMPTFTMFKQAPTDENSPFTYSSSVLNHSDVAAAVTDSTKNYLERIISEIDLDNSAESLDEVESSIDVMLKEAQHNATVLFSATESGDKLRELEQQFFEQRKAARIRPNLPSALRYVEGRATNQDVKKLRGPEYPSASNESHVTKKTPLVDQGFIFKSYLPDSDGKTEQEEVLNTREFNPTKQHVSARLELLGRSPLLSPVSATRVAETGPGRYVQPLAIRALSHSTRIQAERVKNRYVMPSTHREVEDTLVNRENNWYDNSELCQAVEEASKQRQEEKQDNQMYKESVLDTALLDSFSNKLRYLYRKYDAENPSDEMIPYQYVTISSVQPIDGSATWVVPHNQRVKLRTGDARRIAKQLGFNLIVKQAIGNEEHSHVDCILGDIRFMRRRYASSYIQQHPVQTPAVRECKEIAFRGSSHPHAIWHKAIEVMSLLYYFHPVCIKITDFGAPREGIAAFQSILEEIRKQAEERSLYHTAGDISMGYDFIECILYPTSRKNPKTKVVHPSTADLQRLRDQRIIELDKEINFDNFLKTEGLEEHVYSRAVADGTAWAFQDDGLTLKKQRDIKKYLGWIPKGSKIYADRSDVELPYPYTVSHITSVEKVSYPRENNIDQALRGYAVLEKRHQMPVSEMHDSGETEENESVLSSMRFKTQGGALEMGHFKRAFGLKKDRRQLRKLASGFSYL